MLTTTLAIDDVDAERDVEAVAKAVGIAASLCVDGRAPPPMRIV